MVKAIDVMAHPALERLARQVNSQKDLYLLLQGEEPLAAIIPAQDFEAFVAYRRCREEDFKVFDEIRAQNADLDPEELDRDIAMALAEVRGRPRC